MKEPLSPPQARRLIQDILAGGEVVSSKHATEEMANDALTIIDCVNVLRGGIVEPAEWENGSWRYRVHTQRICVVVAFRSEKRLIIVTAWRSKG
jgi:uncharacterized protein DUF4258